MNVVCDVIATTPPKAGTLKSFFQLLGTAESFSLGQNPNKKFDYKMTTSYKIFCGLTAIFFYWTTYLKISL